MTSDPFTCDMEELIENELERSLRRAADEPAHRPEFYRSLVKSRVYVLGHTDDRAEGKLTIPAGSKLSIVNWTRQDGGPMIPFFSSLPALQRAIEAKEPYLELPARALFEITQGAILVLNPGSPYGKEFFPHEISAMLSTGTNQLAEHRVVEKDTRVLLGQPKDYPSEMVGATSMLLTKHPRIKAAYLALMSEPGSVPEESLVIGVEGEGDLEDVLREVGTVVSDTAPQGQPVDLVQVRRGEAGLSEYFVRSTKPFYERTWGARLRSAFGFR